MRPCFCSFWQRGAPDVGLPERGILKPGDSLGFFSGTILLGFLGFLGISGIPGILDTGFPAGILLGFSWDSHTRIVHKYTQVPRALTRLWREGWEVCPQQRCAAC